jgi:hypothetical protein
MTKDPVEGKMASKCEGPYKVINHHEKGAYHLESSNGKSGFFKGYPHLDKGVNLAILPRIREIARIGFFKGYLLSDKGV